MTEAVKARPSGPRNINLSNILFAYRLPAAGRVSILHRASGALLFVFLPFLLYLLDKSLVSQLGFERLGELMGNGLVKLILAVLAWAYLHHFCAGVRHLLMDMHMGLEKSSSFKSALAVFVVSIPLALLVAAKIFGVF